MDRSAGKDTMVADGLEGDDSVDSGDNSGHGQLVGKVNLLALFEGTRDDLAAVGLDAGDGDLKAVQLSGHLNLNLGCVLVGREGSLQGNGLGLVQRAHLSGAALNFKVADLTLS